MIPAEAAAQPPIFVVAGAPSADVEPWRAALRAAPTVIAADGGAGTLLAIGRRPDLVVGDGDSWSLHPGREHPLGQDLAWEIHPVDKDATDLQLALFRAVAMAAPGQAIVVLGALGGRIDHSLANLCLLAHPTLADHPTCLAEGGQVVWLLTGPDRREFEGRPGDLLSLLPLSDGVLVERTEGLHWPLEEAHLPFGSTLGISNRLTGHRASLNLAAGRLACIHTAFGA